MAYVNPTVRIRENNRFIDRGCYYDGQIGRHIVQVTEGETIVFKVDYTDVLNGETITASLADDGVDATPSVAAGIVSITASNLSGFADLDLTVTFSGGRIRQDFLRFCDPFSWSRTDYLPIPVTV
jgi:hypothetical protein